LVLSGSASPLRLVWQPNELPDGRVLIERALVQAVPIESGGHWLRARFRVRVLADEPLEIDLPPSAEHPEVFSAGRPLTNWQRLSDPRGRDYLRIAAAAVTGLLEVRCTIPGERTGLSAITLTPPSVRGVLLPGSVRWQVSWPSQWVPLVSAGDVAWDLRWSWQRGLWTPSPAWTTADLDRWLGETASDEPSASEPLLVGRAATWGSLRVQSVSRWSALWLGTVGVGAGGLALGYLARRRLGVAVLVASGLGVLGVALGLGWPQVAMQVLWASQVGVGGLLLLGGGWVSWHAYRRWRGQRLRGFSRARDSGILSRPGSSRLQLRANTEVTTEG
jgi:hypothetical protein